MTDIILSDIASISIWCNLSGPEGFNKAKLGAMTADRSEAIEITPALLQLHLL